MERQHRSAVTLFCPNALAVGVSVHLPESAAHHARVRRVRAGDTVRLLNGAGSIATATLESTGQSATARVDRVIDVPEPPALEVVVPVADRDRMLLAAEKCVELKVTSWRPAFFARSRSVAPRGEGEKFREKVLARMQAALEQSGGGWLPTIHAEAELADLLATVPTTQSRFVLDASGAPLGSADPGHSTIFAVGPEGGLEAGELAAFRDAGWMVCALSTGTMRFETAIIAGAAVIRSMQLAQGRS